MAIAAGTLALALIGSGTVAFIASVLNAEASPDSSVIGIWDVVFPLVVLVWGAVVAVGLLRLRRWAATAGAVTFLAVGGLSLFAFAGVGVLVLLAAVPLFVAGGLALAARGGNARASS